MSDSTSRHEYIRRLEESLLQPEIRRSAKAVGELLADEFLEIAGDGRIYNKQQIIEALQAEPSDSTVQWTISDFHITELSREVILIIYRADLYESKTADVTGSFLAQPIKITLRSSLWKLINGHWQMVFHQGTVVP